MANCCALMFACCMGIWEMVLYAKYKGVAKDQATCQGGRILTLLLVNGILHFSTVAFSLCSCSTFLFETCFSGCWYINLLTMCVIPFINIASLAVLIVITAVFPGCQNVFATFHSDVYVYIVVCWVLLLVGFVCAIGSLFFICCALMCGSILAITMLGNIAGDAVAKEVAAQTSAYGNNTGQYSKMLDNDGGNQA